MAKNGSNNGGKSAITGADASRIQSVAAKSSGGRVSSGSFAARAQSAAASNAGKFGK